MKITLTNENHGTSVDLVVNKDGTISARQVTQAEGILCPVEGCTQCEDLFGGGVEKTWGPYRVRKLSTGGARVLASTPTVAAEAEQP